VDYLFAGAPFVVFIVIAALYFLAPLFMWSHLRDINRRIERLIEGLKAMADMNGVMREDVAKILWELKAGAERQKKSDADRMASSGYAPCPQCQHLLAPELIAQGRFFCPHCGSKIQIDP